MHAGPGAAHLVRQRLGGGGRRVGVRHLEHGGHPAEDGRTRARLEILLVDGARLAEMHLAVDHSGQDVQPGAVDAFASRSRAQVPYGGDPPVADAHVAQERAVLIDHGAVGENEIESLRHRFSLRGSESGLI